MFIINISFQLSYIYMDLTYSLNLLHSASFLRTSTWIWDTFYWSLKTYFCNSSFNIIGEYLLFPVRTYPWAIYIICWLWLINFPAIPNVYFSHQLHYCFLKSWPSAPHCHSDFWITPLQLYYDYWFRSNEVSIGNA